VKGQFAFGAKRKSAELLIKVRMETHGMKTPYNRKTASKSRMRTARVAEAG
jgi:hypothetical protein